MPSSHFSDHTAVVNRQAAAFRELLTGLRPGRPFAEDKGKDKEPADPVTILDVKLFTSASAKSPAPSPGAAEPAQRAP